MAAKKTPTSKPATTAPKKASKAATKKAPTASGAVLLSSGNPQIPMGDGDGPVQAYIAAMPGWKRGVGERIDALVTRLVPRPHKCVKWNTPFFGVDGNGWFMSMYCYTKTVQLSFFRGTALKPMPPKASKVAGVRYVDISEADADGDALEKTLEGWVRQAAAMPGVVPWA